MRKVADLDLSAASGLVRVGPIVYVVADDEQVIDLYRLDDAGRRHGRVSLGLGNDLPQGSSERKRRKADLECLALLPGNQMIALGSGSSPQRRAGVVLQLAARGMLHAPRIVDLAPLYDELHGHFAELNIEGAVAAGTVLRLLQRGNGRAALNAVIDLDLRATLVALGRGCLTGDLIRGVRRVELGALRDVPLGFTDASPLEPGSARVAFVAAAENTDDPYEDGPCTGSVLGVLDEQGRVEWVEPVEGEHKLEGLATASDGSFWAVADPDDRGKPAPLLESIDHPLRDVV